MYINFHCFFEQLKKVSYHNISSLQIVFLSPSERKCTPASPTSFSDRSSSLSEGFDFRTEARAEQPSSDKLQNLSLERERTTGQYINLYLNSIPQWDVVRNKQCLLMTKCLEKWTFNHCGLTRKIIWH